MVNKFSGSVESDLLLHPDKADANKPIVKKARPVLCTRTN